MRISVFFYGCFLSWLLPPFPAHWLAKLNYHRRMCGAACGGNVCYTHTDTHTDVWHVPCHTPTHLTLAKHASAILKHISLECTPPSPWQKCRRRNPPQPQHLIMLHVASWQSCNLKLQVPMQMMEFHLTHKLSQQVQ